MNYLFLLSIILLLTIISYFKFKKDILSPFFITCCVYLLSILCAIVGLFYWNDVLNLHFNTFFAIILGLTSFLIGELLARYIYKNETIITNNSSIFSRIRKISMKKVLFLIFLLIICIIYIIFQIKKVCALYGFSSNFSDMLYFYRKTNNLLAGGNYQVTYDINFLAKQCLKFCYVVCIFFELLFVNSLLNKEIKRKKIIYFFGMILSLLASLLSTGRSIFMHLIIAFLFIFIVLYRKKYTDKKSFKKMIKYIFLMGITSICLLFALMPLLGRETKGNMIDSISFALGAHIPSFDKKINDKLNYESTIYYSKTVTFNNFYLFLYKNNLISNFNQSNAVWYSFGDYSSNTYTSLSSYYNDYGFFGIIILQFLFGFIVSYLYLTVINKENLLLFIVYSYFFYTVVDQFRGDQFYSLLTPSTLGYLGLLTIVYFYIFRFKTKKDSW